MTAAAVVSTNGTQPAAAGAGPERAPLGAGVKWAIGVVAPLALVPPALGALVSFSSVSAAMAPSFGDLAWTVPVGVDAGIAVFTAIDLIMGLWGMRTRWLRLVPWSLTLATIYLNVAAEDTVIGRVGHGVLPLLWVITVEVVAHILRHRTGLTHTKGRARRIDRVRWSRWLLDPWRTLRLWRRMRLWEITDLTEAHRRSEHQDLARAALQDRYGPVKWRWRAPRRDRVRFRYGHLSALDVLPDSYGTPTTARATTTSASPPTSTRTGRRSSGPKGREGSTRPAPDVTALLGPARAIAAELAGEGRNVTRDELLGRLRAAGHACSNDKARALLAAIQFDTEREAG
jgi:hypothetical protein